MQERYLPSTAEHSPEIVLANMEILELKQILGDFVAEKQDDPRAPAGKSMNVLRAHVADRLDSSKPLNEKYLNSLSRAGMANPDQKKAHLLVAAVLLELAQIAEREKQNAIGNTPAVIMRTALRLAVQSPEQVSSLILPSILAIPLADIRTCLTPGSTKTEDRILLSDIAFKKLDAEPEKAEEILTKTAIMITRSNYAWAMYLTSFTPAVQKWCVNDLFTNHREFLNKQFRYYMQLTQKDQLGAWSLKALQSNWNNFTIAARECPELLTAYENYRQEQAKQTQEQQAQEAQKAIQTQADIKQEQRGRIIKESEEISQQPLLFTVPDYPSLLFNDQPAQWGCFSIAQRRLSLSTISYFILRLSALDPDAQDSQIASLTNKLAERETAMLAQIDQFIETNAYRVCQTYFNDEMTSQVYNNSETASRCLGKFKQMDQRFLEYQADVVWRKHARVFSQLNELLTQAIIRFQSLYDNLLAKEQQTQQVESAQNEIEAQADKEQARTNLQIEHLRALVEEKMEYLRSLCALETGLDLPALKSLAQMGETDIIGSVSLSSSLSLAPRLELRPQLSLEQRYDWDQIILQMGENVEMLGQRIKMVDYVTAHEIAHLVNEELNRLVETQVAQQKETIQDLARSFSETARAVAREMISLGCGEVIIDSLGIKMLHDYGTTDPLVFDLPKRLTTAEYSFHAFAQVAMEVSRKNTNTEELKLRYAFMLLRLEAVADYFLNQRSSLPETSQIKTAIEQLFSTLNTSSLDIISPEQKQKIKNLLNHNFLAAQEMSLVKT